MKTYFIEAKAKLGKVEFSTKGIPNKVGIVSTIQYLSEMKKISDFLWKKGIKAVVAGQILGCDAKAAEKISNDVEAFLYVGTGEFHPIGVALKTKKPVFVLHPKSMRISRIDEAEIEKIRKRKKGMLAKFHSSSSIGVLITTKKGQSKVQGDIERVHEIERAYPKKKFYYFICDTLNFSELENFTFIDCWINTMCPRIMDDIRVINAEEIV